MKLLVLLNGFLELLYNICSDIFGCNVFHILGRGVWSPYVLIAVPALIGLSCLPLAVLGWSRRR